MDEPLWRTLVPDRHFKSIFAKRAFETFGHGPTDDFHRPQIFDGSKVEPPLVGRNVRDVSQPDCVRRGNLEVSVEEIRCDAIAMTAIRRHRHATLAPGWPNIVLFHKLGDKLARDAVAAVSQFGMDARCTVTLLALVEDCLDLLDQSFVPGGTRRPFRRRALPVVKPAPADAEHTARSRIE